MTIKLVSQKVVPVTLALALEFRDMQSLRGERELKPWRCKEQINWLKENKMFTMIWGRYKKDGVWHRGNGNHTSHNLVACFQATRGEVDDTSERFIASMLAVRGGIWEGGAEDLPRLKD